MMMDYKRLAEGLECCLRADEDHFCPDECPYHFDADGGELRFGECQRALHRDALIAARKCDQLLEYLEAIADETAEAAK